VDGSKPLQFGLVAEEVAEVFPYLVVYGEDGRPETVRYDVLVTLLLNELQKDRRLMQAQAEQLETLRHHGESQAAHMAALEQPVALLRRVTGNTGKVPMVATAE
jgi:hypothetical protein